MAADPLLCSDDLHRVAGREVMSKLIQLLPVHLLRQETHLIWIAVVLKAAHNSVSGGGPNNVLSKVDLRR